MKEVTGIAEGAEARLSIAFADMIVERGLRLMDASCSKDVSGDSLDIVGGWLRGVCFVRFL
jgi:hypothetical protein